MRLIDADELKNLFYEIAKESVNSDWQAIPIKHIIQIIDNAPTVELQKGEWIELREYDNKCSICGHSMMDKWDYCPNCGASMVKGGEKE